MPVKVKDPVVPPPEAVLYPFAHTNCCGAYILAPAMKSGVLTTDYSRRVDTKKTDMWGYRIYDYPHKIVVYNYVSTNRREDVELAFKNSVPKLRASSIVQFLFVPEWFQEEFERMIKRRKWFHKAGQSPAGVLYIFCKPSEKVPE